MARRIIAALLIIVATVLAPVAIVGLWAERTLTDTQVFVETIAPLADDPQVRQVVATEVSGSLVAAVDAENRINEALGKLSGPLAGLVDSEAVVSSLAAGINGAIESGVQSYTQSDRFGELWTAIATDLQRAFVAAINRDTTDAAVTLQQGQLVLNTKVAAEKVQAELVAKGVPFADQLDKVPGRDIELADTPRLQTAVDVLRVVLPVASWLWAVVLAMLVLGAVLWRPRARGLMWAGLGLGLAGGLTWLALQAGETGLVAAAPAGYGGLLDSLAGILLRFLATALLVMVALGLAALLAGWLAGGSRSGTRVRDMITRPLHRWSAPLADTWVGRFTSDHQMFVPTLRAVVIVLGVVALFAADRLTPGQVLWTALLVGLGLLVVEVAEGAGRSLEATRAGAVVARADEDLASAQG
ncbi:MAG TPA: hypothetical protein VF143_02080 [Candidatus Nanopelagicales bacterium]